MKFTKEAIEEIRDRLELLGINARAIKDLSRYIKYPPMILLSGGGRGIQREIITKATDYTANIHDEIIRFTATATLTLPKASGVGTTYTIICDGQDVVVTVTPDGSDTINRENSQTLHDGDSMILHDMANGEWCIG